MQMTIAGDLRGDPGRLREFAAAIAARSLSPVDLVRRYLDRIDASRSHVQCWRELDAERALDSPDSGKKRLRGAGLRGPLHGVPVAIKDIIDVEGLPTRANCRCPRQRPACQRRRRNRARPQGAGAIVLGKVHTTEYAFFDPSPACNPQTSTIRRAGRVRARQPPLRRHGAHRRGHADGRFSQSPGRLLRHRRLQAQHAESADVRDYAAGAVLRYAGLLWLERRRCGLCLRGDCAKIPARQSTRRSVCAKLAVCILDDPHISDAIPEMKAALARRRTPLPTPAMRSRGRARRSLSSGCSRSSAPPQPTRPAGH